MKWIMLVVLACVMAGCAYNGQNFDTKTYVDTDDTVTEYFPPVQQPDGTWVALIKTHTVATHVMDDAVKGKNKSTAPPFNAKNNADAQLSMTEGATDQGDPTWTVDMGQVGEIDGGDIAPVVESVGSAVVGGLTAGANTVVEDLAGEN
jgi:hypothetical protein